MPSCSVKWCPNHTSTCSLKSKNGVSFHRFPKDATTCQKWVDAVRHERRDPWWNSSNASRICSIHFRETDISSTPCKVNILAKTAVPVCTMVWYDGDDTTSKTSNERTNADKLILKTYERKKTNINVLKELKVNTSYNWDKGTAMSKTNSVVISNTTPCLSQDNQPQATKLFKTLEVFKRQNLKEFQESNSIANATITKAQKNTVLTESNKKEYVKSCKEKCCKSKIFIKLNDNTNLILDEDLSNDDTIFRDSTKVSQEPNSRTCENSKKVTLKQFKSNENKEPNERTNISNADLFVETITNGNVDLNANISKSYVGKMLRTYLPKRKDKIIEKNIRESSTLLKINKNIWSITMEKGLNIVKSKEVNNTNVNEYPKDKFRKKLNTGICNKSNIFVNRQSNKNPQEKNQRALLNVKKYTFKRSSNLFKRPKIREQKTVGVEPNMDINKESNIAPIDEFISNQSRIDNNKETDTAVYDEIISELFEISKNVRNVSNIPLNENMCIDNNVDSDLDKGTSNRHVILEKDTNIYTELNTSMDLELYRVRNSGLNCEKTELNTDKTTINENTMSETNQQMAIINKNMCFNENITNNAIFLPNNELPNLETSVLKNIVPETEKEKFTELKKYLSIKPKLESPSELCTNALIDIDKNIFSRYDNITSTSITKDNLQVSDRDHNAEFNKNIGIDVNDIISSLQSNFNTDATKEKQSNSINSKQLNPILFDEFINNISPESNNSRNVDFITNFKTDPNTTREPESNEKSNVECKKTLGKDMPDLDAVMNLELCSEVNIGFNNEKNTEFNTDNVDFSHYNENTATKLNHKLSMINKNMSMEQSDHLFPITIESDYHSGTVMNGYNTTKFNKNMCHNENITNNAIIMSNNELQHLENSVSNIATETKKDNFNELKKHLSTKTNLDFAKLCINTVTDTILSDSTISTAITKENIEVADRDLNAKIYKNTSIHVNDITSLQNNMNTESILLEELITNTSTENFIGSLKTNPNTTRETMNKISDIIDCKKSVGKDMPELNTAILSELSEDKVLKSDEVMNKKLHHLYTEMYADKDLLFQKSKKDFVNVLATSDDQNTVVNEHMDVADGILNRDIAAEIDLSLLLSETPMPDEEIQNLNNNSNNNSLDNILGSPNWIQLPTVEMPKIIDDILDQGSPFFENLNLFDKANKANKEAKKKDNEFKKLINEKYSTPNFDQFCENGKQCTKNSIEQIENQLIAEISDYNETNLKQSNNICNENKVSPSKKVTAEKYYVLYDEQTDKQILEQYLKSNNDQCEKFNLDQIVDQGNENRDKEIQFGNNTINQCQLQNNVDLKEIQIEDPRINQFFEQSEKLHREQDGLDIDNAIDKVFNDVDIFELSKKQCNKQFNEQTYKSSVGKRIIMEESVPKSKMHSQGTVESNVQEIKRQLFEDCDVKRIEEVNNVSNEAYVAGTESVPELNIGQLKRVIFEQCYDPDCRNDCKNQNHNSNTEKSESQFKKDDEQYKKQTNYTPCQPDIEKRKKRYDLLYKRQCYQTSTENFKKQIKNSSFDPNTKEMNNKSFLERHKLSHNEKYKTKYKKIAIHHIPGQYVELRWKESEGKSNTLSQEGCKRKHKELGLNQRKMLCSESTNNVSQQIMAECPECGYTTDDNDLMNFKSDVDLRITKPLSLINKDMLISLHDIEAENMHQNNGNKNRVPLESLYAMEIAYVTAIQALERKLKQKIAISEYRLRRVNNLSKINNQLTNANITLMDLFIRNKV